MAGLVRLIVAAVVLAMIAKVIDRARRSDGEKPPPQWPAWNERNGAEPPRAATPVADRSTVEAPAADQPAWAEPVAGECPDGFPIKVKTSSGIYHVEGMMNYARLSADRCYSSTDAAEADGYRASKR